MFSFLNKTNQTQFNDVNARVAELTTQHNELTTQHNELIKLTTASNEATTKNAFTLQEVLNRVAEITTHVDKLQSDVDAFKLLNAGLAANIDAAVTTKIAERQQSIVQEREDRLNSNVPHFDIVSEVDISDDRVKYEMDWNPAFIKHLRKLGISGKTEEEIVLKYVKTIASQIEENLPE